MTDITCPTCKNSIEPPFQAGNCPFCKEPLPKEVQTKPEEEALSGEMVTNWDLMTERLGENPTFAKLAENRVLVTVSVALMLVLGIVIYSSIGGTSEAPDFTVKDTEGVTFSLSDYEDDGLDKVVILDFMFTTCGPCEELADETIKPYSKEMPDDVVIISISVFGKDSNEDLREHAEKNGWRHALGDDEGKIEKQYQVSSTPKVFIIDQKGRITFEESGMFSRDDLKTAVEEARSGSGSLEKVKDTHIFLFAITTGFIVFFSPCAFPLLPGYMTYYLANKKRSEGSTAEAKAREALPAGLAAGAGLMSILLVIGALLILVISLIGGILPVLEFIIGALLVILGIAMIRDISLEPLIMPFRKLWMGFVGLFPASKGRLSRPVERAMQRFVDPELTFEKSKEEGLTGLFLYGVGYGTAASGCVAPIVAGLLATSLALNLVGGIIVFILFSASAAVLMVTVTLMVAAAEDTIVNKLKASTEKIRMFGGVVMVIIGIYLITYFIRV